MPTGSSPRMRGAPATPGGAYDCRFIPAHAGSTQDQAAETIMCRFIPAHAGSTATMVRSECQRFIPAHAGSTAFSPPESLYCSGSSPRMRGAPQPDAVYVDAYCGSSPRMRGALWRFGLPYQACRFIPAHAGSTAWPYRDDPNLRFIPAHAGSTYRDWRRDA